MNLEEIRTIIPRMDRARYLLPPPGEDVVGECLGYIRTLLAEVDRLTTTGCDIHSWPDTGGPFCPVCLMQDSDRLKAEVDRLFELLEEGENMMVPTAYVHEQEWVNEVREVLSARAALKWE